MFHGYIEAHSIISQTISMDKEKCLELMLGESWAFSEGLPHPSGVLETCSLPSLPLIWSLIPFFFNKFSMSLLKAVFPIVFNYPHFSEDPTFISHCPRHQDLVSPSRKWALTFYKDATITIPALRSPSRATSMSFLSFCPPLLCLFSAPATPPTHHPKKKGEKRDVYSTTPVIFKAC